MYVIWLRLPIISFLWRIYTILCEKGMMDIGMTETIPIEFQLLPRQFSSNNVTSTQT
jgi:hypothetical protein